MTADDDIWDSLFHNADSRIMPIESSLLNSPELLTFPLLKARRHNMDVLFFANTQSTRKERIHAGDLSS